MAMRRYLIDKKEDMKGLDVKKRLIEFPENKNFITAIVGPRRAGKTYALYDFILRKGLKDEEYLFINFEDDDVRRSEREEIIKSTSYHEEIYGIAPKFIFLDEVQGLNRWHNWVYSIYERKRYNIFITGSSSKLLSKELATQLRGRCTPAEVLPLSFKEILSINRIEKKKFYSTREENKIKNLLRKYLRSGGFPDVVLGNIEPKRFFKDYVDLIVFKDLVERFSIKNIFLIRFLIDSSLSSFAKEFSIHNLYRILKARNIKVSKKTLYSYSGLLEDVMFSFPLSKFSYSLKESMLSTPKMYINDPGLINNTLLLNFGENVGRLMENVVFLELERRKIKNPLLEFYYWKDYQQREVDFVLKEGSDIKQLIQVTYASGRDEIEKREIDGLVKASTELKSKKLVIITWDHEDERRVKNKKIRCVPLWKWLIEQ